MKSWSSPFHCLCTLYCQPAPLLLWSFLHSVGRRHASLQSDHEKFSSNLFHPLSLASFFPCSHGLNLLLFRKPSRGAVPLRRVTSRGEVCFRGEDGNVASNVGHLREPANKQTNEIHAYTSHTASCAVTQRNIIINIWGQIFYQWWKKYLI